MGRLLYLTLVRPDISYSVQHLSQFLQHPRQAHYRAALHVLKYLKGTINKGLFYSSTSDLKLQAFCDADGVLARFQLALLQVSLFSLALLLFIGRPRS